MHVSIATLLLTLCLSELLTYGRLQGFSEDEPEELFIEIAFLEYKGHFKILFKQHASHKTGLKQILFHPSLINNLKWLIAPCDRECIAVVYQIAAVLAWGVICLEK